MKIYPLYIFDLDGTLFRGQEPLPYARDVLAELRSRGASVRFLTNNSSVTPEAYVAKLRGMGFQCDVSEMFSSAMGAATLLAGSVSTAFVVGEVGISSALSAQGISVLTGTSALADAVVVGICRSFTYDWMNEALQHLLSGARFVATNRDATYPMEGGRVVPGAGAIVASLVTCSGREPETVGKPSPYLVEMILASAGVQPEECLVVGDRYDTDILAGLAAGCPVHLVLTGVSREAPEGVPWSADLRGLL